MVLFTHSVKKTKGAIHEKGDIGGKCKGVLHDSKCALTKGMQGLSPSSGFSFEIFII